jgi:nickel/cobalt transporter (NicO) family protein
MRAMRVQADRSARLCWQLVLLATFGALILVSARASASAQVNMFAHMRATAPTGISGWILAKQALFYRALDGMIRAAKTNGSAYWGLIGISFIYGIFHAAGPGHGKAVISSYLVANEETWRRGVALSFAAALLQACTAIAIVAIAAILLGATAKMMGDTVKTIEIVSYSLIVLLGLRLLWIKGRSFLRAWRAFRVEGGGLAAEAHPHHAHVGAVHHDHSADSHCGHHVHSEHAHACELHAHHHTHHHRGHRHKHTHEHEEEESVLPWGHAHGPEPEELAGPRGWRRGLSAIVAVGLRPCSGAIIVLVFALAQGLFWAGVASTFVMGLGTAITVSSIASVAVGARSLAMRLAATRAGYGSLILRGGEAGAALLVIALGIALLTGYMASERMGLF